MRDVRVAAAWLGGVVILKISTPGQDTREDGHATEL